MIDDIIFNSHYFYINLPIYSSGQINKIEAESTYFILRLALPERISVS